MMNIVKVLVTFTVLSVTLQLAFVAGTNYTVGAPGGWDLNTNYTKWVSTITFYPGDNLIFSYATTHDVWEVKESDYQTCTKGSAIKQYTGGNNVIALTEAGSRYFYCSITGHCGQGMKLQVSVVTKDSSSPPSPPSGNSPPSPPKNDAAALNGIGTRLAIALVLGEMLMFFV
ncbi:Blue copper protein [Carex littledalei]|uniref:Blue copper protein n=1 Tax=Carex littledalei TaxID=544730 RepID=A0A833QUY0_9POAL|nr:Blue copper protein [Carex littledalei]